MNSEFSEKNQVLVAARERLASSLQGYPARLPQAAQVDAWIAASGLQKAIRRGATAVALACAARLLEVRPDRLWRRLGAIGIEDVGIADLEACRQVIAISGQKAWRRQQGGDARVASYLIDRLCAAAKERSCDDLIAIAEAARDFRRERCDLAFADGEQLCHFVADPCRPLGLRALAAWYLAGTERIPGRRLVPRSGSVGSVFALYRELGAPDEILGLCEAALAQSRTALPIMLPLVWLQHKDQPRVVDCALPEVPNVQGVPAYAFDGFSRIGRSALSQFLATCAPIRDFITAHAPNADPTAVVAVLVFHAEGGLVNRRLIWMGSETITRQGILADIAGRGLAPEYADEGLTLLREHMSMLHEARNAVAGRASLLSPAEPTLR